MPTGGGRPERASGVNIRPQRRSGGEFLQGTRFENALYFAYPLPSAPLMLSTNTEIAFDAIRGWYASQARWVPNVAGAADPCQFDLVVTGYNMSGLSGLTPTLKGEHSVCSRNITSSRLFHSS